MTERSDLRVLVIGGGAVGTWLAGSLAAGGARVTVVEPDPARLQRLDGGLLLAVGGRSLRVRTALAPSIERALEADRPDVAVVAVKSYHTATVAAELAAAGAPSRLASFQNGIGNDRALLEALPHSAAIAATLTTGLQIALDGSVHGRPGGGIGLAYEAADDRADALASAFRRGGLAVRRYPDASAMKWSKLLLNLLGSATTALLGLSPRNVFADRRLFALERAAWLEALAVMRALRVAPCSLPGYPVPLLAAGMMHMPPEVAFRLLGPRLAGGRGDRLPSVAADIAAGRRQTENPVLTGAVVTHADAAGVGVPVSRELARLVDDLAAGGPDGCAVAGSRDRLLEAVGRARVTAARRRRQTD